MLVSDGGLFPQIGIPLFKVLILVLVDVGLGHPCATAPAISPVLILVLVDVGLGRPVIVTSADVAAVLILVLVDVGLGLSG